ncbi:hypothetical protein CDL15_Pgr014059 [Punica granatum]|uniref:Uncharacterized protein n=2 Tax=Punica granatum TaxID=22663 RepID=A0A218WAW3_PUNGR|nr:hypothetical protein CDL15_Pgr014059 [Punica granatum]
MLGVQSVATLLLLISTLLFISLSHGGSLLPRLLHQANHQAQGIIGDLLGGTARLLIEGESIDLPGNSSMILAENRTDRRDPLDGFRHYTGGWNISNKHYIYSVGFTAVPLLLVAAIWFLGFGLCLCFICICHFCLRRQHYSYSRLTYGLSLGFLILFTIAVLTGSIVLHTGQGMFHGSTESTMKYVVKQADDTARKLRNVSDDLNAAKGIEMDQMFLPSQVQNNIDSVTKKVNASASTLQSETEHNSHKIRHALNVLRIVLITIAAVMLLLAFLGSLLSILGYQSLVPILVIVGWILVALTFISSGAFLVLHNLMGDTCVAMDEWVQNPTAHSALDDILPCVDNATAQETLYWSKDVSSDLVGLINKYIGNVSNSDPQPSISPSYYNQSGPLVPLLCSQYHLNRSDQECTGSEVNFDNASEEWRKYICQVSEDGICTSVGRLRPESYNQMMAAVNISNSLYNYGAFLVGLQDCSLVRETFRKITRDHCPRLRLHSKWIYVGMVMVSSAVMLLLISWVVYARDKRHRMYMMQMARFVAFSNQDHSSKIVSSQ